MVYIELVVLIDFLMNYLVLVSTGIILNRLTHFKKAFLSSAIGSFSLIFLYLNISNFELIIINILFSFVMSVIAFKYKSILYTIKNIIYMYFISIFLAGALYLITTNLILNINNQISYTIILLVLSPLITYFYIKNLQEIKNINSNYYCIDIYLKDKPLLTLNAFLDTGNNLFDPYKRYPIILVSKEYIPYQIDKPIIVPYNTIDNHGLLSCFKPLKIYIHNIGYRKKVLIGIIDKVTIENAECILNKKLLERI